MRSKIGIGLTFMAQNICKRTQLNTTGGQKVTYEYIVNSCLDSVQMAEHGDKTN